MSPLMPSTKPEEINTGRTSCGDFSRTTVEKNKKLWFNDNRVQLAKKNLDSGNDKWLHNRS